MELLVGVEACGWVWLRGAVDVDALVGAVPAGGVAELAADAFIGVDQWTQRPGS